MIDYKVLKNEYYEIIFPNKYEEDIKEILEYSTTKLIDNLFFLIKYHMAKLYVHHFLIKRTNFFLEFMN